VSSPQVAIVTVSYGSDEALEPFLASVSSASADESAVVVADNRPGFGEAERIATTHGAEYLPMPANLGYGGAVNRAVRRLPDSIEWVLISNPDIVLGPGSLDVLVATGSADPRIGSIGPRVLNADGSLYPSAREVPSLRTGIGHALLYRVWPGNPWTTRYHRSEAEPGGRDAGWLSGSCLLVRRRAFDELGGFDDSYFMYFEDVDLGYRLGKSGWLNRYEPAASVIHTGAHSTSESSSAMIRVHHDSAARFVARKYPSPLLWPVRAIILAGLRVRAEVETRRGRGAGG